MKNKFNIIFILCTIFVLSACSPEKYKEYSDEDKFQHLIGLHVRTLIDVEALGVTFGSLRSKQVDYVFIVPKPNFSGPEVVFRNGVPSNSRFKIIGVYGSDSFLFENSYYFHVSGIAPNANQNLIHLIEFNANNLLENGGLDINTFILENTNS